MAAMTKRLLHLRPNLHSYPRPHLYPVHPFSSSSESDPSADIPQSEPLREPDSSKEASLEAIRRNMSEFRLRLAARPPSSYSAQYVSTQELCKKNVLSMTDDSKTSSDSPTEKPSMSPAAGDRLSYKYNGIRESLCHLKSNINDSGGNPVDQITLAALREALKRKPDPNANLGSTRIIGEGDSSPPNFLGKEINLKMFRERLAKLEETEEKKSEARTGIPIKALRDSLQEVSASNDDKSRRRKCWGFPTSWVLKTLAHPFKLTERQPQHQVELEALNQYQFHLTYVEEVGLLSHFGFGPREGRLNRPIAADSEEDLEKNVAEGKRKKKGKSVSQAKPVSKPIKPSSSPSQASIQLSDEASEEVEEICTHDSQLKKSGCATFVSHPSISSSDSPLLQGISVLRDDKCALGRDFLLNQLNDDDKKLLDELSPSNLMMQWSSMTAKNSVLVGGILSQWEQDRRRIIDLVQENNTLKKQLKELSKNHDNLEGLKKQLMEGKKECERLSMKYQQLDDQLCEFTRLHEENI